MTADEATIAVIDALERAGIPFMIVGSLASNFHGIPRATRDADFLVQAGPASLPDLAAALPDELRLESQGSFEAVTGTMRYVVTLRHSPFVCELFLCGDDPHDTARFLRRQHVRILGHEAFVATADDMIITKLRWIALANRSKDRDDVRNMIAVRGDDLDWDYIGGWSRPTRNARTIGRGPRVDPASLIGDGSGARMVQGLPCRGWLTVSCSDSRSFSNA